MGRTYARAGMALAVATLATTGGLSLLSGTHARAAEVSRAAVTACAYSVRSDKKADVYPKDSKSSRPLIAALTIRSGSFSADCNASKEGLVQITKDPTSGVHVKGGWVERILLDHRPKLLVGVSAGGGGTADHLSPLGTATGLALVTLGGGVAIMAWRRRAKETVLNA